MKGKRKKARRKVFFSVTLLVLISLVGGITYKLCNTNSKKNSVVHKTVLQANAQLNDEKLDKPKNGKTEVQDNSDNSNDNLDKHKIIKDKNVNAYGLDCTIDRVEVSKMLSRGYKSDGKKYVFLTIDDGPSTQNTANILDILKSKNIKATFFIIGKNIETKDGAELIKREFNEGHAIGNHGYTHDPKKLYPGNKVNVDYFMSEIKETNLVMKKVLGDEFDTKVIRMPGGHMSREHYKDPNLNSLDSVLSKDSYVNIDWNCENLDAKGKKYSNQEMLDYVIKTSENNDKVVILIHDAQGKVQTKEILPQVIDYFKSKGYEFKTIS